jgi:hypothetical protein
MKAVAKVLESPPSEASSTCCLMAGLLVACCLSQYTPALVWSKPLITRQTPGLRHGWPVLLVHCEFAVSHAEIALDHRLFLMPFCSPIHLQHATHNAQRCLSLSFHSCDRIPNSAASAPIVLSLIALLLGSTPMAPRGRYLVGRVGV